MAGRVPPKGFSPFIDLLGLSFGKCENGQAECSLQVRAELLNSQRILHGGVAYAVADSGMGLALYSFVGDDERVATMEVQIVYFKAVTSGSLTCNARVLHRSKRLGTVEAELMNDGRLVAKALGTFSISKRRKVEDSSGRQSPLDGSGTGG